MIGFIVSPMGAGKTLTMTLLGYLAQQGGTEVFSNYKLNFPHTPVRSPQEMLHIKNGLFLGDELWSWMDARASATQQNKAISQILLKSRKMGYDILHTAQFKHQPDKRLREHTDWIIVPEFDKFTSICKVTIYRYFGNDHISEPINTFSFKAKAVFPLYDSFTGIYDDDGSPAPAPVPAGTQPARFRIANTETPARPAAEPPSSSRRGRSAASSHTLPAHLRGRWTVEKILPSGPRPRSPKRPPSHKTPRARRPSPAPPSECP